MTETIIKKPSLTDCTDAEIEGEHARRFGMSGQDSLDDYTTSDLQEELEDRGVAFNTTPLDDADEILDLVAEAARTSPQAARAYDLMRRAWGETQSLSARQFITQGRMGGLV